MQPITKCGPKGISVSRFFDFLIKLGKEKPKAVRDEKINIKGIEIQPKQIIVRILTANGRAICQ